MKRNSECKRKLCAAGSNLWSWHEYHLLQGGTDLKQHQPGLKQRDSSSCSMSVITRWTIQRVSFGPWAQKGYSNRQSRSWAFSPGTLSSFSCLQEMPNMRHLKVTWFSNNLLPLRNMANYNPSCVYWRSLVAGKAQTSQARRWMHWDTRMWSLHSC